MLRSSLGEILVERKPGAQKPGAGRKAWSSRKDGRLRLPLPPPNSRRPSVRPRPPRGDPQRSRAEAQRYPRANAWGRSSGEPVAAGRSLVLPRGCGVGRCCSSPVGSVLVPVVTTQQRAAARSTAVSWHYVICVGAHSFKKESAKMQKNLTATGVSRISITVHIRNIHRT